LLPPGIEAWSSDIILTELPQLQKPFTSTGDLTPAVYSVSDTILTELSQLLKLRQFQMQVPVLFEEKVAGRERE
jgi:hypothetical protein